MVWGMRTRHIIARWLGYESEISKLRARCALLEEQRHGARTRSRRNLAHARVEQCRADAATGLLIEARAERDSLRKVVDAYDRTLNELRDEGRRVEILITRARHTMNINTKGAQAHLDQAVRLLKGEA